VVAAQGSNIAAAPGATDNSWQKGMRSLCRALVIVLCALSGCAPSAALHPQHPPLELHGRWVSAVQGDTADALARKHGAPVDDVAELNDVDPETPIAPGTRVFIPRWGKEVAPRAPGAARPRAPPLPRRALATFRLSWPVSGTVSSRFGPRSGRMHEGIDIVSLEGTPVRAAAAGEVVYSGNKLRGFGNLVILLHEGRFLTVYAHNRENLVRERTYVDRGQVIAHVGSTGHSTAPHLHFEVRLGDVPKDPLEFLEEP
jgi:murein DD-endopeptidase MepM/ murein hydrolase activator NlpD